MALTTFFDPSPAPLGRDPPRRMGELGVSSSNVQDPTSPSPTAGVRLGGSLPSSGRREGICGKTLSLTGTSSKEDALALIVQEEDPSSEAAHASFAGLSELLEAGRGKRPNLADRSSPGRSPILGGRHHRRIRYERFAS